MSANKFTAIILFVLAFIILAISYSQAPDMSNWKYGYVSAGALSALAFSYFYGENVDNRK